MSLLIDTSAKMEGRNILKNGYDALVEVSCCWMGEALVSGNPSVNRLRSSVTVLDRRRTPYPTMHN